jgi:DnaJ-class molecular chaperone
MKQSCRMCHGKGEYRTPRSSRLFVVCPQCKGKGKLFTRAKTPRT